MFCRRTIFFQTDLQCVNNTPSFFLAKYLYQSKQNVPLQPAKEIRRIVLKHIKIQAKNYFKYNLQMSKRFVPLQSQNKGSNLKELPEAISGYKN